MQQLLQSFVCRKSVLWSVVCFENIQLPFFSSAPYIFRVTRVWRYLYSWGPMVSAVNFQQLVNNRLNEFQPNWPTSCTIIVLVIVVILFCFLLVGNMDPERQIYFIAKWICIFYFKMKGAAVFEWTVLRCDHLVCMECFKKNKDFPKTIRSCQCGVTFPESAYKMAVEEMP